MQFGILNVLSYSNLVALFAIIITLEKRKNDNCLHVGTVRSPAQYSFSKWLIRHKDQVLQMCSTLCRLMPECDKHESFSTYSRISRIRTLCNEMAGWIPTIVNVGTFSKTTVKTKYWTSIDEKEKLTSLKIQLNSRTEIYRKLQLNFIHSVEKIIYLMEVHIYVLDRLGKLLILWDWCQDILG